MPLLKSQGVLMSNGTAMYIPAGDIPIDSSGNVTFSGDVTVGKDLIVTDNVTVGQSVVVQGNIGANANIAAAGLLSQGDPLLGTTNISVDLIGNPNIKVVAEEGGDGQAYFELTTNKLTTATNLHTVRSIMGNTGDYTLEHEIGAPGVPATLQQMVWNSAGTEMEFAFGGAGGLFIKEAGLRAPSYITLAAQNPDIAVDATTTIFTISASSLPIGKAVQIPVNLFFFDGDITQFYFVTLIVNAARFGNEIYAYAENQAAADTVLLQQTGEAWNLLLAGSGTATLSIQIETEPLPAPVGSTGWFCNFNATFLGAQ